MGKLLLLHQVHFPLAKNEQLSMRKGLHRLLFLLVFSLLLSPVAKGQFYYGLQQQFGKNRVQYHDFTWSYYRCSDYDVYYYRNSREVAQYVAEFAGKTIKEFEKYLDFPLDDRLDFLVYNKHTDLKQSNIELSSEEDYNTGGLSRIVGSRVFLYFTGDYRELDKQIRAGVIQVILNQMMFGGNIRDVIRSSTFINLPDWYTNGLVSFLSDPDNLLIQNKIRDGIRSKRFEKFKILQADELTAAGHAIWQYIAYTYGPAVIPQILYMTRVNNNIESGFNFILGADLKKLNEAWIAYYQSLLIAESDDLPEGKALKVKAKQESHLSQFKLNPDRDLVAYVSNELGKFKIFVQNTESGKARKLYQGGFAIDPKPDYSYPLLAWHPTGRILAIVTEEKGNIHLKVRDIEEEIWALERPIFHIDKILSINYSPDGKRLLMSAMKDGQLDIYEYSVLSNTFKAITNDIYEDFEPVYLNGEDFIAFASTRPDDTLRREGADTLDPMPKTDLFIYRNKENSKVLWRLTRTPNQDEQGLDRLGKSSMIYLVNRDGYRNRNVLELDSAISFVDTITHYRYFTKAYKESNYNFSVLQHDIDPKLGNVAELFYYDGNYHLHLNRIPAVSGLLEDEHQVEVLEVPEDTEQKEIEEPLINEEPKSDTLDIQPLEKPAIKKEFDLENYQFHPDLVSGSRPSLQPEKAEQEEEPTVTPTSAAEMLLGQTSDEKFELPKPRNYVRAFYTNYFVSQLDNSFLDQSYQPFTGGGPLYLNPSFNGLIKLGLGDLFEDYKLVGAMRLSTSLDNAEYYLSLKNYKKRWDHIYNFNRKSLTAVIGDQYLEKVVITNLEYQSSYPFSEVEAIKGSVGFRYDHGVLQATDNVSLNAPDRFESYAQARFQYVYDNTIPKGLNLYNGLRGKVFFEHYQNISEFDAGLNVIGLDVRHYLPIHRTMIFANRFAASTSFGASKLIYFMGGVDSWFSPDYNYETPIAQNENYTFQTLATNMRGFHQNARNGNSFFVYNSEIRLPLFTYLLNRPIKSEFVKNFQINTFFDVGTAWTGRGPYAPGNALNNTVIKNGSITVQLDRQREPMIYGYGFGLRSKVLGYFVRMDWAWGVEDGITLPRVFYLSLSQDF